MLGKKYLLDLGIHHTEVDDEMHENFYSKGRLIEQGDLSTFYGYKTLNASGYTTRMGKVYAKVLNNVSELNRLDPLKLLKAGVAFVRLRNIPDDLKYLHYTSNNTIFGTQFHQLPCTESSLVCDMSSDILSRPVDVNKFSMIYGGVQKNLGPAGATLVILKKGMLEKQNSNLTAYMNYANHSKGDGLFNTPPVFSIWGVKLVLEWIKKNGGAQGMAKRADLKSSLVYDTIDSSGGFITSPVDKAYRSKMNIVFRLPNEELEKKFISESKELGMLGLKGHRSVGGLRASIYNSLPVEDVQALTDFMKEFARVNG